MSGKNGVPILFRPDGRRVKQKKPKTGNLILDEVNRTLNINGVSFSLEMLSALVPPDEKPRGPFWIQREGDSVALYELEESLEAKPLSLEGANVDTTKLPEN